ARPEPRSGPARRGERALEEDA
ncbi:MAG: hypothetical protein JWL68_4565, partial [Actinomycetia bacterium]|nr:hypothetical protein [Actinomycetes bacterium]